MYLFKHPYIYTHTYVSTGDLSFPGRVTAARIPFSDNKLPFAFHSRASLPLPCGVAGERLKTLVPRKCVHVSSPHEELGSYNRFKQI